MVVMVVWCNYLMKSDRIWSKAIINEQRNLFVVMVVVVVVVMVVVLVVVVRDVQSVLMLGSRGS